MSWLEETDPWITERLSDTEVADAEQRLTRALRDAMSKWLNRTRKAVLDGQAVTAAADEGQMPDLDRWPPKHVWEQMLTDAVTPIAGSVYDEAFRKHAAGADFSATDYRQRFIAHVHDRLSRNLWPDGVFEECRYELMEAQAEGESISQTRDRVARVLGIDAPSREIRAKINEARRAGKRPPSGLFDKERVADRMWHYAARRIARTEVMTSYNGGTKNAGYALQEMWGEPVYKVWYATTDSRTRKSHRRAHLQVRRLDETFDVGGSDLDHPGDPRGRDREVINCRCTLLTLRGEQAQKYAERYALELPNRTDNDGNPITAADQPEHDDGSHFATGNEALDTLYAPPQEHEMDEIPAPATGWAERTAAAIPAEPPADWFTDPQLTGPTKIRVLDTGRVVGHLAAWGVEHASLPGVTPPRDPYGGMYPRFHRHPVRTADGSRINTGPLATGGHAEIASELGQVIEHYDDPTFVAADVRAGEDAHGIWVSGALRKGITPFQVMLLDRYSISGDWRDGELVAACSVSVPGFHLDSDDGVVALSASAGPNRPRLAEASPRERRDSDGHQAALVAAGIVKPGSDSGSPQQQAEAHAWAQLRAQRRVARTDRAVTAAARRVLAPGVADAARRIGIS